MGVAFRIFQAGAIAALFEEAPDAVEDNRLDINADRNRPAKTPADWLANIKFHSGLDNLEIGASDESVTISHASVAAASPPGGISSTQNFGWGTATDDHLLLTHGLSDIPTALVAVGSEALYPGMPIQDDGTGSVRYATVYCTATEVRLFEFASTGPNSLAAKSIDYTVMAIRKPRAASGNKLLDFDPATGEVSMALDQVKSLRRYLQVVTGGTPFGLALGRTIDLHNGGVRFVLPNASHVEPVPAIKTRAYPNPQSGYGSAMGYDGAFTGGTVVQVKAP